MKSTKFLQTTFIANGVFSGVSGLVLSLFSENIGTLLGYSFPELYTVIGIGLLLYAGLLFYRASKNRPGPIWTWFFIAGDLLWVMGSAILLGTGRFITTGTGQLLVVLVAFLVLAFAVLQFLGRPRTGSRARAGD